MIWQYRAEEADFSVLVGCTVTECNKDHDKTWLSFTLDDGRTFILFHRQDCCEGVYLDDVCGDLADIVGSPILLAEAVSVSGVSGDATDPPPKAPSSDESWTWTFYKIATVKGSVTLRWYGVSNGYYSERVTFALLPRDDESEWMK